MAALLQFQFIDVFNNPIANAEVTFALVNSPNITGSLLEVGDPRRAWTDASGSLSISIVPATYRVRVYGEQTPTDFYINVPQISQISGSATVVVSNGIPVPLNGADKSYVLTVSASDARYARLGSLLVPGQSYPITSSWSLNAVSASYAPGSNSASSSFSVTSSFAVSSSHALTSSFSQNSLSASFTPNKFPDISDVGGNVGILNTSPQYALDVAGPVNTQYVRLPFNVPGNQQGSFQFTDGVNQTTIGAVSPGNGDFIFIYTDRGGQVLTIMTDSSGRIGIGGQTSPQYTLDISGDLGSSANGDYHLSVGGTNPSWVNSNGGNFGIGNISPAYALDVNGDINFTGNLLQNGSPIESSNVSSSYSVTSSFALSAKSASVASTASFVINAQSASFISSSGIVGTLATASFAVSASHALTSSFALNSISASYAPGSNSISSSYSVTSSYSLNAKSASFAVNSSLAQTASVALIASSAGAAEAVFGDLSLFSDNGAVDIFGLNLVQIETDGAYQAFAVGDLTMTSNTQNIGFSYPNGTIMLNGTASFSGSSIINAINAVSASVSSMALFANTANAAEAVTGDLSLFSDNGAVDIFGLNLVQVQTDGAYQAFAVGDLTMTSNTQNIGFSYPNGTIMLNGTASFSGSTILHALSASFATTSSKAITSSYALSASALNLYNTTTGTWYQISVQGTLGNEVLVIT